MKVFTPAPRFHLRGNPLACAVGMASLEVLVQEKLDQRSFIPGEWFRKEPADSCKSMRLVRGKGLLNAIVFQEGFHAWDVCVELKNEGLLAKQTHGNIIRFAPPLVIQDREMEEALRIIEKVLVEH